MVRFSGKSFRFGEKIRLVSGSYQARIRLAPSSSRARPSSHRLPGEKPVHSQHFRTRNPVSTRSRYRVEIALRPRSHAPLTCGFTVVARGADLRRCRRHARVLLEVLYAALNQRLELVAGGELGDVLVEARTGALRVTHLAQDTTIGAGNALDS